MDDVRKFLIPCIWPPVLYIWAGLRPNTAGALSPTSVLLTLWSLLARDTLRGDGKDGESLSNKAD
jgi:hypothetical protein